MARTSRKNIVAPVKSPPTPKSEYSAALYARISVEDERKREADTIGNQIQLLRDFGRRGPGYQRHLMCIADDDVFRERIFNGRSFPLMNVSGTGK